MSSIDLTTLEPSAVIDARGSACPGPLLEAKKGMGKIQVGEVMEVKSNDEGSRSDLSAWGKKVGHEFLGFIEADGHDRLFLRRGK